MSRDYNSLRSDSSTHTAPSDDANRYDRQVRALWYLVRNGVDPNVARMLGISPLGRWTV